LKLGRPVDAGAVSNRPNRFYPYASTGQGHYQIHHGVEFVNPSGTPVIAVAGGTVVVAGADDQEQWGRHLGYYGLLIVIRLDDSYSDEPVFALYGHLSQIQVVRGQHVQRDAVIGQVGMSGVALGPHLHFEVRAGQNTFYHTRNPELWFDPLDGHGIIAGSVRDENDRPIEGALVTVHPLEQPDRYWRETHTYEGVQREQLGRDDYWDEDFALGDVPIGDYVVRVRARGKLYTRQVTVRDRSVAFVSIRIRGDDHLPKTGPNGIILQP
ncbi:MAG: peptidoglycan DD-metalloendopeptidase family protein, partial [Anaerolineae bacterium]|nr:peptidoglycan DD-metalloendopeptidase family protein [Anaerolineae bacterium]